jgi:hypothetical protein
LVVRRLTSVQKKIGGKQEIGNNRGKSFSVSDANIITVFNKPKFIYRIFRNEWVKMLNIFILLNIFQHSMFIGEIFLINK